MYSPALTDFIAMVEGNSYMHITGPDVVKTVTHEEVTSEDLGGASVHSAKSGVAHPCHRHHLRSFKAFFDHRPWSPRAPL